MSIQVKYRTIATATGGREGLVRTQDGHFEAKLSTPKELGGPGGDGTNPEQLFAAGYSACFLSSLKYAAHMREVQFPADASVKAEVSIGAHPDGGFGLAADLSVSVPGVDRQTVQALIEDAHHTCPYSNATRNNIDVHIAAV